MASIGPDAAEIFNTFDLSADDLASIVAIKDRFKTYFTPQANITYERYLFNRIVQQEGETFDEFLTKIRTQSAKCDYGVIHDSLLRDKIVIGIRSENVREQLLADGDSTLDRVTTKCRAAELASKQITELKSDGTTVYAFNKHQEKTRSSQNSSIFDCRNCGKKCNKCGISGHFQEKCRSSEGRAKPKASKKHKKVYAAESDSSSDDEYYINSISDD